MNLNSLILASVLLCPGLCGCSSGVNSANSDEESFTFPQEFEEDGAKWTKSSGQSEAELRDLTVYFQNNPSVAEGSVVGGDPTLYTNSKGHKRFYWVRNGFDQLDWVFIQFQGRTSSLKEGRGSPFPS